MPGRDPDRFLAVPWPVERLPGGDLVTPHLTACAAVHRSVLERVRFDPRYGGNAFREETDFFFSCAEAGIRTILCRHAASGHVKEHTRAAQGGSWTMGRLRYAFHLFVNNWRFVSKHRRTLDDAARAAGVPGGPVRWQLRFLREELGRIRPTRA